MSVDFTRMHTSRSTGVFNRRRMGTPQMAAPEGFFRRFECILHREAASIDEYLDLTTLEARLQVAARHLVQASCQRAPAPAAPAPAAPSPAPAPAPAPAEPPRPPDNGISIVEVHQRWILFMRHCSTCQVDECSLRTCLAGKRLMQHIWRCDAGPRCDYPNCVQCKPSVDHFTRCCDSRCPVCVPIRNYLRRF